MRWVLGAVAEGVEGVVDLDGEAGLEGLGVPDDELLVERGHDEGPDLAHLRHLHHLLPVHARQLSGGLPLQLPHPQLVLLVRRHPLRGLLQRPHLYLKAHAALHHLLKPKRVLHLPERQRVVPDHRPNSPLLVVHCEVQNRRVHRVFLRLKQLLYAVQIHVVR